jgi:hypothetical protein
VPATALEVVVAEAMAVSATVLLKTLNFSNALLPVAGTSAEAAVCRAERAPFNEPRAEILPWKTASFRASAVNGRCSSDISWLMMLFTSRFEPRPGDEIAMFFSCCHSLQ